MLLEQRDISAKCTAEINHSEGVETGTEDAQEPGRSKCGTCRICDTFLGLKLNASQRFDSLLIIFAEDKIIFTTQLS
jgi:hypothetical protein